MRLNQRDGREGDQESSPLRELCTSHEALDRFCDLSVDEKRDAREDNHKPPSGARNPVQRHRAATPVGNIRIEQVRCELHKVVSRRSITKDRRPKSSLRRGDAPQQSWRCKCCGDFNFHPNRRCGCCGAYPCGSYTTDTVMAAAKAKAAAKAAAASSTGF